MAKFAKTGFLGCVSPSSTQKIDVTFFSDVSRKSVLYKETFIISDKREPGQNWPEPLLNEDRFMKFPACKQRVVNGENGDKLIVMLSNFKYSSPAILFRLTKGPSVMSKLDVKRFMDAGT